MSAVKSDMILYMFCKAVASWELVILADTGSRRLRTYSSGVNSTRY